MPEKQEKNKTEVEVTRVAIDESGTENIRPETYVPPTDEQLRKFVLVGQSPFADE